MLPASNRGLGMSIGFPDVCATPTPAGPVPVPYPNIAMNMQAAGFSPTVRVCMMNALNMSAQIPMTSGDEAGSAHPTLKGPGRYTMGSPNVYVDGLPAITLTSPTSGNNMNNPVGAVLVPSLVTVFFSDASAPGCGATCAPLDDDALLALDAAVTGPSVERAGLRDGAFVVRLASIGRAAGTEVFAALRDAKGAVELDLRGCRGGAVDAALEVAALFVPAGVPMVGVVDDDGDTTLETSRGGEFAGRALVVRVDGGTASAAELLGEVLLRVAGAVLVGAPTFGKLRASRVVPGVAGGRAMVDAARYVTPSGEPLPERLVPRDAEPACGGATQG